MNTVPVALLIDTVFFGSGTAVISWPVAKYVIWFEKSSKDIKNFRRSFGPVKKSGNNIGTKVHCVLYYWSYLIVTVRKKSHLFIVCLFILLICLFYLFYLIYHCFTISQFSTNLLIISFIQNKDIYFKNFEIFDHSDSLLPFLNPVPPVCTLRLLTEQLQSVRAVMWMGGRLPPLGGPSVPPPVRGPPRGPGAPGRPL